jgi:hypothetical protein
VKVVAAAEVTRMMTAIIISPPPPLSLAILHCSQPNTYTIKQGVLEAFLIFYISYFGNI